MDKSEGKKRTIRRYLVMKPVRISLFLAINLKWRNKQNKSKHPHDQTLTRGVNIFNRNSSDSKSTANKSTGELRKRSFVLEMGMKFNKLGIRE